MLRLNGRRAEPGKTGLDMGFAGHGVAGHGFAGHEAVLAEIHNSMADYAINAWRVCG